LLEPDEVLDALMDLHGEQGAESRKRHNGHYLYMPDEGPLRVAARAHIAELKSALASETYQIELRYGELASEELAGLLAGLLAGDEREGAYERLAAQLGQRLMTAARSGDSAAVTQGVETFYLQDYDVEIAQAASILDPIVASLFEGLTFWCVPTRAPSGELVTSVDLVYHAPSGALGEVLSTDWDPNPMTEAETTPLPIGEFKRRNVIELAASHPVRVRHAVRAEDGVWTPVAMTALDGERMFAALLRVTGRR
jgi:hypothetical protein